MRRALPALVAGVTTAGIAAPASAALRVSDGLTFTRPDGSRVDPARDVRVWCGPWEPDVPVRTGHVGPDPDVDGAHGHVRLPGPAPHAHVAGGVDA